MKHPRKVSKKVRLSLGFMARNASVGGRRVLANRRRKGRHSLTVSDEFTNKNKRFSRRR